MVERKFIEPSMSPWSSSNVLVQKKPKDGSIKYRFYVDYRSLNGVTMPDVYTITNIVDSLDSLGRSKIFTVFDMASGYHQISIKPEHREKTAFSCHRGHFQFIKMPFGLNNAPATYQRCIDIILMVLKGNDCLVYLDIICFSVTELELLAFLFATKQFRCYLYGRKFTVHTDYRALKWLLNLQDPSSRLTRWAIKLSEYDYVVEHRPGIKMRNADALSRSINKIEGELVLSKDVIEEEKAKDEACTRYSAQEHIWKDDDGVLYRQEPKNQPRVVIPETLVPTVLVGYHELPFTAYQGVSRTAEFINRKYWWEDMRDNIAEFIRRCDACAKRKAGRRVAAPLGRP